MNYRNLMILATAATLLLAGTSCTKKLEGNQAKGTLVLDLKGDTSFGEKATKAVNLADYTNKANYTVQVTNIKGKTVFECTGADLANFKSKELEIGSYTAKAFCGNDIALSRNAIYVAGETVFSIESEKSTSVTIDCVPTSGRLSVEFDPDMAIYFKDYHVTYSGAKALGSTPITWAQKDTEPWYVKLDPNGEVLTYMIHLTLKDEYKIIDANGNEQSNSQITNTFTLKPNKAHKLRVSPNYTPSEDESGLSIGITIDETTNDKEITIEVPSTWI